MAPASHVHRNLESLVVLGDPVSVIQRRDIRPKEIGGWPARAWIWKERIAKHVIEIAENGIEHLIHVVHDSSCISREGPREEGRLPRAGIVLDASAVE